MSQRHCRRIAPLPAPPHGAPALAVLALCATLLGCQEPGTLEPAARLNPASVAFAGGIPFGVFQLPNTAFGDRYNGAHRNILPADLLASLSAIQSRGGRVVLVLAGGPNGYKDADGHFSFALWRSRVDRFKSVDFSPFVALQIPYSVARIALT